jgi:hypothetical protein
MGKRGKIKGIETGKCHDFERAGNASFVCSRNFIAQKAKDQWRQARKLAISIRVTKLQIGQRKRAKVT